MMGWVSTSEGAELPTESAITVRKPPDLRSVAVGVRIAIIAFSLGVGTRIVGTIIDVGVVAVVGVFGVVGVVGVVGIVGDVGVFGVVGIVSVVGSNVKTASSSNSDLLALPSMTVFIIQNCCLTDPVVGAQRLELVLSDRCAMGMDCCWTAARSFPWMAPTVRGFPARPPVGRCGID